MPCIGLDRLFAQAAQRPGDSAASGIAALSGRLWTGPLLLEPMLTALGQGECVRVFGPRRTGKPSLLRECACRPRADSLTVIEVNGEGMDAVASLFRDFVAALDVLRGD